MTTMVHISKCKIVFLLMLAVLAAGLFPAFAHAATTVDDRTFVQSFQTDATEFKAGQSFVLNAQLTCPNHETYKMYAYSSTIRINTDFFEIGTITARTKVDYYITELSGENAGWSDIVLNFLSTKLAGMDWQETETVLSIELTPKSLGSSTVKYARVNVSNNTGMKSMPYEAESYSINVNSEYVPLNAADDSYTMALGLYKACYTGKVSDGFVPTFKGKSFLWDGSQFVLLLSSEELSNACLADFSQVEAEAETFILGDANMNGYVNIVDAEVAYEAAKGVYSAVDDLTLSGWLAADKNADGVLDSSDARAIQAYVHGLAA